MKITLPWPDKRLSPNARCDRRFLAHVRNKAKEAGHYTACEAGANMQDWGAEIPLNVTFHPPDNQHRDTDNMLASCKYMLDGMANAMRVDDAAFNPITLTRSERREGGAVVVEIGAPDSWQSIGGLAKNMVQGVVE